MDEHCGEILDLLERYLDGECPRALEQVVEAHLQDCPPCMDRSDFELGLRRLVAAKCHDAAPAHLVARVTAVLRLPAQP